MRVIRRHFLAAAWTQLSASPRTVLFRWKSVIDHVEHQGGGLDDGEA